MGCSVCGTKAIEGAAWTYHGSPPRTRPSNRPELVDMDQENSGAYSAILSCRLHKAYSYLPEAVNMKDFGLLEGKLEAENRPFSVQVETNDATAQTTVVKEVFPAPAVSLTPLNYEESSRLKDSLFHNSLARKYVKEEERLRVATRRAEYANRAKGFTRIVEATRLKPGEAETLGEPVYTMSSLEVIQVPMDTVSSGEERKEAAVKSVFAEDLEGEEWRAELQLDEKEKEFASSRSPQRHNTAVVLSGREPLPPRSPAAESEEMTESTGQMPSSELARRKLDEIKMTVKQRQEERKGRGTKQSFAVFGQKSNFSGRDNRRHPTDSSSKEAAIFPLSDSEPRPGRPKSNSTAGTVSNTGPTSHQSSEKRTREERKSAVIGAVRLRSEDQEPRFSDPIGDSSEEEGLITPQLVSAEAVPELRDSEGSVKLEETQESISPIPPIETYAGVGGKMQSFPGLHTEEGRKNITGEEKRELEEGKKYAFGVDEPLQGSSSSIPKPAMGFLGLPHPISESEEELTPVPSRSNPAPSFQIATPSSLISLRGVPEAEVRAKPLPPVDTVQEAVESDYLEESKKSTVRTLLASGIGKSASSGSPRDREVCSKATPSPVSNSQVYGTKHKSAEGTPNRTPRPATERGSDLAFLGHAGATLHIGESRFRDSCPVSSDQTNLAQGQKREIPSITVKSSHNNGGKTMSKAAPRPKLSSKRTSEVFSFHRLQEEAAVLIQRAARQFLGRRSRDKACQSSTTQYMRVRTVLELLEDRDVLAGLRMLGGLVEYMEERGLREM